MQAWVTGQRYLENWRISNPTSVPRTFLEVRPEDPLEYRKLIPVLRAIDLSQVIVSSMMQRLEQGHSGIATDLKYAMNMPRKDMVINDKVMSDLICQPYMVSYDAPFYVIQYLSITWRGDQEMNQWQLMLLTNQAYRTMHDFRDYRGQIDPLGAWAHDRPYLTGLEREIAPFLLKTVHAPTAANCVWTWQTPAQYIGRPPQWVFEWFRRHSWHLSSADAMYGDDVTD